MAAIVHPPLAGASASERRSGSVRLLFRFGVGLVGLAGERLLGALRAVEALGRVAPEEPEPVRRAAVRDAVVGVVVSAPPAVTAALQPARTALAWFAGRGSRALRHVPGARAVARRWRAARAGATRGLDRLSATGHAEVEAGRRLAQTFVSGASEAAVARVADSPELKRVIGEQSQGLATTAVNELRERSARADTVAESVWRRLTGRPRSGGPR